MKKIITLNYVITACSTAYQRSKNIILLMHGAFGNQSQFIRLSDELNKLGYKVCMVTLPCHQAGVTTDKYLENLSIYDYVDYIDAVVNEIGNCIVVGHSMGGLLARKVATQNKHIKGLVDLCGSPGKFVCNPRFIFQLIFKGHIFKKIMTLDEETVMSFLLNDFPETLKSSAFKNLVPESSKALNQISGKEIEIKLPAGLPVIFIAGLKDRMLPLKVSQSLARKYARPLYFLDGCHMMHMDPEFAKKIGNTIHQFIANNLDDNL